MAGLSSSIIARGGINQDPRSRLYIPNSGYVSPFSYVGGNSVGINSDEGATAVNAPAGTSGNLLVLAVEGGALSSTAGWTTIYTSASPYVYYRVADGTAADDVELAANPAEGARACMMEFTKPAGTVTVTTNTTTFLVGTPSRTRIDTPAMADQSATYDDVLEIVAGHYGNNSEYNPSVDDEKILAEGFAGNTFTFSGGGDVVYEAGGTFQAYRNTCIGYQFRPSATAVAAQSITVTNPINENRGCRGVCARIAIT